MARNGPFPTLSLDQRLDPDYEPEDILDDYIYSPVIRGVQSEESYEAFQSIFAAMQPFRSGDFIGQGVQGNPQPPPRPDTNAVPATRYGSVDSEIDAEASPFSPPSADLLPTHPRRARPPPLHFAGL